MLVSVDADKGIVTVYGSTVVKVPITQVHKLASMLRGKTVEYVREVTLESGDDILDMVGEIADSGDFNPPAPEEVGDGRMWIRATGSGQLYLKLDDKVRLQFQHPGDFVCLDRIGYDIADRYPVVKALLKKRKLEIVSTTRMNSIKRQVAQMMEEKEEREIGSLIVDTSVKGKDPKALAATLAARRGGERGEVIDMDDHSGGLDPMEGLSDEQRMVLREGWGSKADDGETEVTE